MKLFISIIVLSLIALNINAQEIIEIESLPKKLIGGYISKTTIIGSDVKETPKNTKVFLTLSNTEIKLNGKTRKISSFSKFTQKGKTMYFIYFEDQKNYWIIVDGKKVEYAIMEQNTTSNKTIKIYGVDKK